VSKRDIYVDKQRYHQSRGLGGAAIVRAVQLAKCRIEALPIDQIGESIQRVALIEQVVQAVAKQIGVRG